MEGNRFESIKCMVVDIFLHIYAESVHWTSKLMMKIERTKQKLYLLINMSVESR